MQLGDLLPRQHILVPLDARDLRDALRALAQRLVDAGAIRDQAPLERLFAEARLRDVITAGPHAVVPHYRTDAVDRLVVALGVAPEPISAASAGLDVNPRIVAIVLAPPGAATLHLQTVSTLARYLRQESASDRLARAGSVDEVLRRRELRHLKIQPRLTVRDIMAHRVDAVSPESPVRDAIDRMIRNRVRAVVVVGDKREVMGIVTHRDIMRALLPQIPRAGDETTEDFAALRDIRVRDVMSRSVLCITEDMGLDEVANLMINKDLEQLPVVSEGRLSGFLTRGDIIRKLFGH
jgi:CBS domain-containing protein/mannitol/fructose-specific phosphotransferase system IIA component (Ntr-type)